MAQAFRKDINGLRAIAVIAVVLFHFQITGFSGGFAGVDIFFVISGYLMTMIIFNKVNDNRFSLVDFYLHRARRIIPALAVLCLFLVLFGYLYLLTPDYRELMQIVRKVMLFVSNHTFYQETGYFDTAAHENWLLHTWSLSVEWQFYIVYPILILVAVKLFGLKITKVILLALGTSSLALSIFYTPINPSAAFYLLPTRAWEMIAGGIVFLFPLSLSPLLKRLMESAGLLLILAGILLLTNKLWPSYLALIPVVGTMLVISSAKNSIITNNAIFQYLGKISYSVYLWHWPIAVFLNITGFISNILYVVIGMILSIILGTLSYFLIEKRAVLTRGRLFEAIKYLLVVALTIGIAAGMGTFVKHKNARNNFLFSEDFKTLDNLTTFKNTSITKQCLLDDHYYPPYPECKDGTAEPSLIVLGDSHAGMLFPSIQQVNTTGSSLFWAMMACPIVEGVDPPGQDSCTEFVDNKLKQLRTAYPDIPVIFINFLSPYFYNRTEPAFMINNHLAKDIDEFKQQYKTAYVNSMCEVAKTRPVYILKPIPYFDYNVPKKLAISLMTSNTMPALSIPLVEHYSRNKEVLEAMEQASQQCGVNLIDPIPYLCPDGKNCLAVKDGKPLYFDDNHLNSYGAETLVPALKPIFE